MYHLSPSLTSGVVEDELVILSKTLRQVTHSLVRRRRECLVHVQIQTILLLELQIFPDECNNPTYLLFSVNLEVFI